MTTRIASIRPADGSSACRLGARAMPVAAALLGLLFAGDASSHALFPGRQTVRTVSERALLRFQAVNGRRDVSLFEVEIFDRQTWAPSRLAVASPSRLTVLSPPPGGTEAVESAFTVLVDLDGKPEQRLWVCTKSISRPDAAGRQVARVNTRVCSDVRVTRF